jgi:hypothetical protein
LTLTNAQINKNTTVNGGGVYNDNRLGPASLNFANTGVSKNIATVDGGGIFNSGGSVTLSKSVSVTANTGAPALGSEAGIFSTVDPSVPSGDVKSNQPDNIVQP